MTCDTNDTKETGIYIVDHNYVQTKSESSEKSQHHGVGTLNSTSMSSGTDRVDRLFAFLFGYYILAEEKSAQGWPSG